MNILEVCDKMIYWVDPFWLDYYVEADGSRHVSIREDCRYSAAVKELNENRLFGLLDHIYCNLLICILTFHKVVKKKCIQHLSKCKI